MIRFLFEFIRKLRYPFLLINGIKVCFSSSVSKDVYFKGKNVIGNNCIIRNSKIGFGSYIGDNCIISGVEIGNYCSIAYGLKILVGKHPTSKIVSTHPAFFSTRKQAGFSYTTKQLFKEIDCVNNCSDLYAVIGSDVWIGTDVMIKGGIKIGDGAVIGARSLVLHDVKPYEIVAGVPAKTIGYRFDDDQISFLEEFRWWEKKEKWLRDHIDLFTDIDKMKEWVKDNEK